MKVYHGTTTWKALSLVSGDFSARYGLYVTDTKKRAAKYANSQADQAVTRRSYPLSSCAVIAVIETDEAVKWSRRSEQHPTLDQCEAVIQHGRIIEVLIGRPGRSSFRAVQQIQALRAALPEARFEIVAPLPTIHNIHLAENIL